uniref:Uncharacterized protein n=1 Tax=Steinernema glaseri TaxID=37863 RepID=A0A1I7Y6C8_9BILA
MVCEKRMRDEEDDRLGTGGGDRGRGGSRGGLKSRYLGVELWKYVSGPILPSEERKACAEGSHWLPDSKNEEKLKNQEEKRAIQKL